MGILRRTMPMTPDPERTRTEYATYETTHQASRGGWHSQPDQPVPGTPCEGDRDE